jgi:hypothetical protein
VDIHWISKNTGYPVDIHYFGYPVWISTGYPLDIHIGYPKIVDIHRDWIPTGYPWISAGYPHRISAGYPVLAFFGYLLDIQWISMDN